MLLHYACTYLTWPARPSKRFLLRRCLHKSLVSRDCTKTSTTVYHLYFHPNIQPSLFSPSLSHPHPPPFFLQSTTYAMFSWHCVDAALPSVMSPLMGFCTK